MRQVEFVAVLVQRHAGAGLVAVDQAGVGHKAGKPGCGGGIVRQAQELDGQRRPGRAVVGVERCVAVAAPVAHPAERAAVGQRHRHALPAGRDHVAKRRLQGDVLQRRP